MAEKRIQNKLSIPKYMRLQNKEKNRIKNIMNFRIFPLLITINFVNLFILRNIHLNSIESKFSKITLKIDNIGIKNIFSSSANPFPDEIYINQVLLTPVNYKYNFTNENNSIELIWNNNTNSSYKLFEGCSEIKEIDLSDFDTSEIENMAYMFSGCTSLVLLNLSNFNTSKVTSMGSMFYRCNKLFSLDLSHFNTSQVFSMRQMFDGCKLLTSLNLSNFNTSKVLSMNLMFNGCSSLKILDVSKFNTSKVTEMNSMFSACSSLISLNLSSFNTSKVTDMSYMFYGYNSPIPLNLSNFITSSVTKMSSMFSGCSFLNSLDLSNFDTSKVKDMNYMFSECVSLQYINLKNFSESSLTSLTDIFKLVPDNVVLCLNENNTNILNQLKQNIKCYTINCSDDWKSNQKKIVNKTDICIDYNDNYIQYLYEFKGKYYDSCFNGTLINNHAIKSCECDKEKCQNCSKEPFVENLCSECKNGFYQIENDNETFIGDYFNCFKNPEGYYLDQNEFIYKKCYSKCETCEIKGDNITHNCLKCNSHYPFEIKKNNFLNCYQNYSYYHNFEKQNNSDSINNIIFPFEYSNLILNESESSIKDINSFLSSEIKEISYEAYTNINLTNDINYEEYSSFLIEAPYTIDKYSEIISDKEITSNSVNPIKNLEFKKMIDKLLDREKNVTQIINYYGILLEKIEEGFTSENFDPSDLDKEEEFIESEKITITLTTTKKQRNYTNNNTTAIDLGQCEILLKQFYNISMNETLYMKKIAVIQEGMKIPKIEYDIYYNLSRKNLQKLNLSICTNNTMNVFLSMLINENLDILNSSSVYYNDLCYKSENDRGLDITLEDRRKKFIENNKTLCQDDCIFSEYDFIHHKVKCSCMIKESSSSFADINIDKTNLFKNSLNSKNFLNFHLLVCYKNLFNRKNIFHNIAFIILSFILLFHIICIFIFYIKDIHIIKNIIEKIISEIKYNNSLKIEVFEYKEDLKENEDYSQIKKERIHQTEGKKKRNLKNQSLDKRQNPANININNNIKIYNYNRNINKLPEQESVRNIINSNLYNQNIIRTENIKNLDENEINILSYDLALQYDKRPYFRYYISLIKSKHNFIYLFNNNDIYNSKIIKFDFFFYGFATYYAINTLFYSDNTIHKVYENKGSYILKDHFQIIIYSSLISIVLNIIMKLLVLSSDMILIYKQNISYNDIQIRGKNLENKLKIKFIVYFSISSILLLFFWYYISMFGAVYINNQYHLLKNVLISFGLSLLYPFVIFLLSGFFRFTSLSGTKKNRKCLYNFGNILQNF